ncbi:MAG: hypothetical protein ACLFV4_02710 [Candidatus Hydrogenedentota bacterium]
MSDEERWKGEPGPEDKDEDPFRHPSDDVGEGGDEEGGYGGAGEQGQGMNDLPPLSDFESSEDDVGSAQTGGEEDEDEELGGLPPLSDLGVDDGAGERQTPGPEFEQPSDFATPASDSDFGGEEAGGTGFHDLTADSDFSPETPEFSPGPDSDMETPTFDSAFGAPPDTSAPTQAMESPMFGAGGEDEKEAAGGEFQGFDEGAFGADMGQSPFGEGGTPAPDFSADTGFTGGGAATPPPAAGQIQGGDTGGGGMGRTVLVVVGLIVVGLIGILAGPHVARQVEDTLPPVLNPYVAEIDDLEAEIQQQDSQIRQLRDTIAELEEAADLAGVPIEELQEELENLVEQHEQYTSEIADLEEELADLEEERDLVADDLAQQQEEFVQVQQEYEDLLNETAIVEARQEGLVAEVDRLRDQVGELEEANERRAATIGALESNAEQLLSRIEGGIDLTPPEYARADRINQAEDLLERIEQANWVEPDLLEDYTELYLEELEIAERREYFFARIPVQDRFGTTRNKWAECLMNGNWSVYFRTIDGTHSGIYMNMAESGDPRYEFVLDLPRETRSHVEEAVTHHRSSAYEQQVEALAGQDKELQTETAWQRAFGSL